ncbi:MAG: hypothetical protein KIS95_13160 [Anaerolineae bacterium]|uniref:hypothetical protein n=1 Tax=Promineifilum sp. TaxID=2664178 RepID=UPI001DEDE64E|nr:hypothetical protein [Anaerolineales bacterium]MCO5178863.1 hypothetical protein [Promineifilum sp.]MCW5848177.1 hypothetical protein [Anaerolineae bacterium]
MAEVTTGNIPVYLEIGQKRTFAGAIDWPGWGRSGRDEAAALGALFDYGPRYAPIAKRADLEFTVPQRVDTFHVVERLPGDSATDYGIPATFPAADREPLDADGLSRFGTILAACWQTFDAAAAAAVGVDLRKGPRGGGRDLEKITDHVLGAEQGYLRRLAWKVATDEAANLNEAMRLTRQAIMDALAAAERGEIPESGPRGGKIWPARYFVRRVAWHVLDHAWEIEDRAV